MRRWNVLRHLATAPAFLALVLAGCEEQDRSTAPPSSALSADSDIVPRSEASELMVHYYARAERSLLTKGLLRTDGGGSDATFTGRQLVDNFVRIGLYEEFSSVGGRLVAAQAESRLRRWEMPVRMAVEFGRSVPIRQRARDRNAIANYRARLSRLTGLPIVRAKSNANFHVFIVNEDERRVLGPELQSILPGISRGVINAVQVLPRSTYCLVIGDTDENGGYSQAIAVIRGEQPDLLRLSCIHEEIAQGLGLSNDSPVARPSVFNDDEEFGLLTFHDELLLRILYDPRMRIGMTVDQARSVAEIVVSELLRGRGPDT